MFYNRQAHCWSTTFTITATTFYVPVVTLSTQGDVKLLEQLKSGFERTITEQKKNNGFGGG